MKAIHEPDDLVVIQDAAFCRVNHAAPEVGLQDLAAVLPEGA